MAQRRPLCLAASFFLAASCASVQDDFSRQLLQPPPGSLAEPADVGIAAEPFEIALPGDGSLSGYWIPQAAANGRTVVLLHAGETNASVLHPYYSFLHAAGFQVLVVDPRGYGKSRGTPSLRAWIYDLPALFDWLHARADVDRTKIAVFGTGLGSVAAMWASMAKGRCRALVFEGLPSLRDMLRETIADDGSAVSAYRLGMLEFASMPEDIEAADNAPKVHVPALFVLGEHESERDRRALLRAYEAHGGERQLWLVPGTGNPPHAMLTHDGEYQRTIVAFLEGAFADRTERVAATWKKTGAASDGDAWYELEFAAAPAAPAEPWAVEACAVQQDGTPVYTRAWLEGARGSTRLKLKKDPRLVAATRVHAVLGDENGGFLRQQTHLSRSAAAVAPLWPRIEELRNDTLARADCERLAAELLAAAAEDPFHQRLENELADVWARLGKVLLASDDAARRTQGRALLERAVAAVPAKPNLHVWPGPTATTYGFPQATAVAEARRLLQAAQQ